ncbi:hypothetical protein QWZ08_19345 [Ferruginibacter paludis]|uniref:hypothetical protein n=1 Tax=Ferruginibacter paludis TaxID=1310417 RepID=UPI0025B3F3BB|nr:hypothetical protein [Ferruginibacter paludis]MDN3657816.1 hypothetical protein [Ferruginibacter paludis]
MYLLKLCFLIAGIGINIGLFDIHVVKMDNTDISIGDLQGKKIMIAILPVTNTKSDIAFLKKIDMISKLYVDKITVIGVPAYEYGYDENRITDLQDFYNGIIGKNVIITKGMYTNKTSADKQHPLFSWLTDVNQNTHFDQEVKGVGEAYFISAEGELYGVIGPEKELSDILLKKLLQLQ